MIPFFSIIIPSYNRADLILNTIESVLQQSFEDFELIVVDDGSTDNTDEVVKSITDSRFSYHKKKNSERGATRNFGIKKAKGKYISFIDSDDLMYSNALQNAYEHLVDMDFPHCFAQAFEVRELITSKLLHAPANFETKTINEQLIRGNFLGCIGVFIQNEILQEINFEEDRMFAGTEDWLLWLRLSARHPFYFSNIVCACMIEHQNRSVLSFSEDKLLYRSKNLRDKLLGDDIFIERYGQKVVEQIFAHMLSYTALHLAMSRKKSRAIKYLVDAVKANFFELFTRRTLGIFKTILMK